MVERLPNRIPKKRPPVRRLLPVFIATGVGVGAYAFAPQELRNLVPSVWPKTPPPTGGGEGGGTSTDATGTEGSDVSEFAAISLTLIAFAAIAWALQYRSEGRAVV